VSRNIDWTQPLSEEDRAWASQFAMYDELVTQNDAVHGVEPEPVVATGMEPGGDRDYENKTVAWLVSEIERRNDEYGTTMAKTGRHAELVQRLREDDAASDEAE
jgi:hypothetical protein